MFEQFCFGLATSVGYKVIMLLNLHLVILHLLIIAVITKIIRQMFLYQICEMLIVLSLRRNNVVDFLVEMEEELILLDDLIQLGVLYFNLAHLRVLQLLVEVDVVGGVVLILVLVQNKLHQRVVRHFIFLLEGHHAVLVVEDLSVQRLQYLGIVLLELRHHLRFFQQLLLLHQLLLLLPILLQPRFLRWQVHLATFDLQLLILDHEAEELVHFGFVVGNHGVVLEFHDHELVDVLRLHLLV